MASPNLNFDSKRNKSVSKASNFKSDVGLVSNDNFYSNQRGQPSKTNWRKPEESFNDSLPDIRNNLGRETTPDNLK